MSAAFLIFVIAFIVKSTAEIARGVYGRAANGAALAPPPACVAGISRLAKALDRAMGAASASSDESAALATFDSSSQPEWSDLAQVEGACSATPEGKDAFSALTRLRLADESFLRRKVAELAPIRRDVEAYLR